MQGNYLRSYRGKNKILQTPNKLQTSKVVRKDDTFTGYTKNGEVRKLSIMG